MFQDEESIRVHAAKTDAELEAVVDRAFDRLGRVEFFKGGEFEVRSRRFETALATTRMTGRVLRSRKGDEWDVVVEYEVRPTALCWVLLVLGVIFLFLLGALLLLVPYTAKNDLQRRVANALRDVRYDAEG